MQDYISKITKLSKVDRDLVSSGSEVLDQKRSLSIKVEEGLKYDPKCLKTIFHLSKDAILFDIRDVTGSAPFVILRYILNKV
jgi:hypothetical protein